MTRASLLDSALKQFAKQGIYTARVEDITEGADVAKGVFYNYFDSKAALVADLLLQGVRLLEAVYLKNVRRRKAGENRVRAFVEKHEAFWEEHPEYALLFHQSRGLLLLEPGASPKLNEAFRKYLECIASLLTVVDFAEAVGHDLAMQRAAALAGLIAGHRSFASAAGLPANPLVILEIAVRGFSEPPSPPARAGDEPPKTHAAEER